MKRLIALTIIITFFITSLFPYETEAKTPLVEYNLEQGGTQVFYYKDSDGNQLKITIEEINNLARIDDGLYKITCENPGLWTAGFTAVIHNNTIGSVYSPFYSTVTGTISSGSLYKDSNTKATYSFLYKLGIMTYSTGVIAEIKGTSLTAYKK